MHQLKSLSPSEMMPHPIHLHKVYTSQCSSCNRGDPSKFMFSVSCTPHRTIVLASWWTNTRESTAISQEMCKRLWPADNDSTKDEAIADLYTGYCNCIPSMYLDVAAMIFFSRLLTGMTMWICMTKKSYNTNLWLACKVFISWSARLQDNHIM